MNNILLTSICSLTMSVPSGFLIYYLSGPSSAEQYSLSKLSVFENNNQYLIGKITSDINNNVATYTGPLTFTCEISSNQACYVKVFNRAELMKKNKSEFEKKSDWFVDATKDLLKKNAYVQINFNKENDDKKITKTETITIVETSATFTIELEDTKGDSVLSNQEKLIKQTITQPQEVDDVDNSRYCLIKMPDDDSSFYDRSAWILPRHKEYKDDFVLMIMIDGSMLIKNKPKIEFYEIEDQTKVKNKEDVQDKGYFDTQNKFIPTIGALKAQKGKWVKVSIEDKNTSCNIEWIDLKKNKNFVIEADISEYRTIS